MLDDWNWSWCRVKYGRCVYGLDHWSWCRARRHRSLIVTCVKPFKETTALQSRRGSRIFCGLLSGPRQHRSFIITCVRPFTETCLRWSNWPSSQRGNGVFFSLFFGWHKLQRRTGFPSGRWRNAKVARRQRSIIVTCVRRFTETTALQ